MKVTTNILHISSPFVFFHRNIAGKLLKCLNIEIIRAF